MAAYAAVPPDDPFAASKAMFAALADELAGPAAAGLTACELEEFIDEKSRKAVLQLLQDHYDLRAAAGRAAGQGSILPRWRAPTGSPGPGWRPGTARQLATLFGTVKVTRCAWRKPGAPDYLPGRRRPVPAGRAALPYPGETGRPRGGPRLVRRRARRDRPPLRPGDRQTADRGVRRALRRRHPRVLRRPGPGAVHAGHAGRAVGRLQGHRDAARGAAGGHREGRREAGEDAHPADGRGEAEPQADGRPGHRLRRRARAGAGRTT